MGHVKEDIKHRESGATISVVERAKWENMAPWAFIDFERSWTGGRMTPKELRELGVWLIEQGERLGKKYKSNGSPRENRAVKTA